jgi:hypothetical protein
VRDRPWTEDDVAELRRLAPTYPASEVAAKLGRRPLDISLKAHDLRISLRIKSRPGPSRNAPKRRRARRKARVGKPAGPFSFGIWAAKGCAVVFRVETSTSSAQQGDLGLDPP